LPLFKPSVASGSSGAIVQVVNTQTGATANGTTQIPYDDTIPQITEGDEYMTLAVTPQSSANTLYIDVIFNFANSTGAAAITAALFQDATSNALAVGAASSSSGGIPDQIIIRHKMTAGTTSSTTFRVRAGPSAAHTLTFNGAGAARKYGGGYASSITITEISA